MGVASLLFEPNPSNFQNLTMFRWFDYCFLIPLLISEIQNFPFSLSFMCPDLYVLYHPYLESSSILTSGGVEPSSKVGTTSSSAR